MARDLNELHVDLDGLPRLGLLKELHLPRQPLAGPPQTRQADIPKDSLDCADRHLDLVNAPQPELGALGAILELAACLADQLDDSRRDSPASAPRVSRHEALHRILPPAHPPAPNRPSAHAESAPSRTRSMESREVEHHQPLSHSPPVLQPDPHIAQSDHEPPLCWQRAAM